MTIIIRKLPPKAPKKPVRKTNLPPHLREVYMFAAKHLNKQGEYVLPRAVMAKEFRIDETTVGRRVDQLERWRAIRKTLTGWDAHHRRHIVHFVLRNATDFLQPSRRKDALSIDKQPLKDALSINLLSAHTHSGQVAEPKPVSGVEKTPECVHAPYNNIRLSIDNRTVVNRVIENEVYGSSSETHSAPKESPKESPLDKARRGLAEFIEADKASTAAGYPNSWDEAIRRSRADIERLAALR
jgi:hypothetical protein